MPFKRLLFGALCGATLHRLTFDFLRRWILPLPPILRQVPLVPGSPPTWSGLYLGADIGYRLGRSEDTSTLNAGALMLFSDTRTLNMNGVVGGGQVGQDYKTGNWVEGLQTDFQATSQQATHAFTCPAGVCSVPPILAPVIKQLSWLRTVRARIGYAPWAQVLIYATGGLAFRPG